MVTIFYYTKVLVKNSNASYCLEHWSCNPIFIKQPLKEGYHILEIKSTPFRQKSTKNPGLMLGLGKMTALQYYTGCIEAKVDVVCHRGHQPCHRGAAGHCWKCRQVGASSIPTDKRARLAVDNRLCIISATGTGT